MVVVIDEDDSDVVLGDSNVDDRVARFVDGCKFNLCVGFGGCVVLFVADENDSADCVAVLVLVVIIGVTDDVDDTFGRVCIGD